MRPSLLMVTIAAFALTFTPPLALAQDFAEPATSATDRTMAEPQATEKMAKIPALTPTASGARFEGRVSYYGSEFAGRRTSSGERYLPEMLTMAHRTLQFGTLVRVTNLRNNLSVVVRVNDRGPFIAGRVGDVSAAAARLLGMFSAGVVQARFEVLGAGEAQAGK